MKIGYSLSNNQGMEDIQGVIDLATRCEDLGVESVWASEHVFNVSYVYDRIGDKPYYEPLTVLTYVAAKTSLSVWAPVCWSSPITTQFASPKSRQLWMCSPAAG